MLISLININKRDRFIYLLLNLLKSEIYKFYKKKEKKNYKINI